MRATKTDSIPAMANTHQLILIRYAKSCSQLFIKYHATGEATTNAITTKRRNSFESNSTRPFTVAPKTFLIPISFSLLCAAYVASPNNPRQPTKMATAVNIQTSNNNFSSLLYIASKFSSMNLKSIGYSGENWPQTFFTCAMACCRFAVFNFTATFQFAGG